MNPDHDREGTLLVIFWAVDVQEEAIFIANYFPSWIIPVRLSWTDNCRLGRCIPKTLLWIVGLRSNKPEEK